MLWLALLALAVWVYLAIGHGGFWKGDQRIGDGPVDLPKDPPEVVAVIPARDEAGVIGKTVASLLGQDYPRPLRLVLVDDGSTDGTAAEARRAAESAPGSLDVVDGAPLPDGWAGKVWAMAQGVTRAAEIAPDARYILFSDADIAHEGSNLRRLVARAEVQQTGLASVMVLLAAHGLWERLLIPPFVFFFQMLYPFAHVNAGRRFAAAGGCMLVRRQALTEAGGLERIHDALIDDCALARLIGRDGNPLWLGLSPRTRSLHPYGGLAGVWNMVARSAYTQLDYAPLHLVGTVLAMVATYLVPPLALVAGVSSGNLHIGLAGGAGYAIMTALYYPTIRFYGQPPYFAAFLPVAALLYTGMTLDSARRHWRGVGGRWKGRVYSR